MSVGMLVGHLQNDKPWLFFQFSLQEVIFLVCRRNQLPPFLRAAAGFLHDDSRGHTRQTTV
jgi:hypothetical protein